MYRFYVIINKHQIQQYYDVQIPPQGKMDLVQAIDALYGHFAQLYPESVMTIQFVSLTTYLKK